MLAAAARSQYVMPPKLVNDVSWRLVSCWISGLPNRQLMCEQPLYEICVESGVRTAAKVSVASGQPQPSGLLLRPSRNELPPSFRVERVVSDALMFRLTSSSFTSEPSCRCDVPEPPTERIRYIMGLSRRTYEVATDRRSGSVSV